MASASVKTQPIRLKSPIIASYPWQTSVLNVDDLSSIFEETFLKDFSEKLMAFEKIVSSASNGDGLELRLFLGFQQEYTHLGHLPLQANSGVSSLSTSSQLLSAKNKSILNMLLVAYRIVDIVASLECHPELPLTYERKSDFGIHFLDRIHDNWPVLLSDFRSALDSDSFLRLLQPDLTPATCSPSLILTNMANNNETSSLNRHVKVLKDLISCRRVTATLINIQLAVISLHRMLNDAQIDQSGGSNFSNEDMQYLEKFCSSSDKLEFPLRLATFVSPIFLLIPKTLHKKKRTDLYKVMETGKCLGNRRPAILLRVEKELFTSLFRLATQDVDLVMEMKNFIGRMPWESLNPINDDVEPSWFKPKVDNNLASTSHATANAGLPVAAVGSVITQPQDASQNYDKDDKDDQMPVDDDSRHSRDTSLDNEDRQDMDVDDMTQVSISLPRALAPEGGPSRKTLGKQYQTVKTLRKRKDYPLTHPPSLNKRKAKGVRDKPRSIAISQGNFKKKKKISLTLMGCLESDRLPLMSRIRPKNTRARKSEATTP